MAVADRAMSPVVGKATEAMLVVLYISLVATTFYGGAIPEYRASAGDEIADRTIASAAVDVESAVPPATTVATVRTDVDIPATIAGDAYRISAESNRLVLEHPNPSVEANAPLVLPERVVEVSGTWQSGESTSIRVTTIESGLAVSLE
jgi:hypothetical protein